MRILPKRPLSCCPANSAGRHPILYVCAVAAAATLANLTQLAAAQGAVAVGDEVCAEGIAMDFFCIARGTLFDNPDVATLEGPDQHSVHCLIEVSECTGTPYEILLAPSSSDSGGLYTRGYRLDDSAKADVQALAQRVGSCGSCDAGGTVERGLTVVVRGQVVQEAFSDVPPTISGNVTLSDPGSPACPVQQPPTSPSAAPPPGTVPPASSAVTGTPTNLPTTSFSPATVRPTALRAPPPTSQPLATTPTPTSSTTPAVALTNPPSSSMPSSIPSRSPSQGESPTTGNESSTAPTSSSTTAAPTSSRSLFALASLAVALTAMSL